MTTNLSFTLAQLAAIVEALGAIDTPRWPKGEPTDLETIRQWKARRAIEK